MQVAFSTDERRTVEQPYYSPSGDEVEVFEAAHRQRLPLMLVWGRPVATRGGS